VIGAVDEPPSAMCRSERERCKEEGRGEGAYGSQSPLDASESPCTRKKDKQTDRG